MRIKKNLAWVYYIIDKKPNLDVNKTGKWMYFFSDRTFIEAICKTAIKEGIVEECKHSNKEDGVSCFYLNDDDIEGHRRVITFFIKNGLTQKKKNGNLYNISFKYDSQTLADEYGDDYHPKIQLEDFVNLETGDWINN